jgi:hypothetical protein
MMEPKIVSIRIVAETSSGEQLYLREDMGVEVDPSIELALKEEVESCGFQTDWLE